MSHVGGVFLYSSGRDVHRKPSTVLKYPSFDPREPWTKVRYRQSSSRRHQVRESKTEPGPTRTFSWEKGVTTGLFVLGEDQEWSSHCITKPPPFITEVHSGAKRGPCVTRFHSLRMFDILLLTCLISFTFPKFLVTQVTEEFTLLRTVFEGLCSSRT